jgi:GNAT superfamily N-acetyltransferase
MLLAVAHSVSLDPVRHGGYQIRPGTAEDLPVYQRVLHEALGWHPEATLPPIEQVLAHPELAIYHRDWGRAGDLAVVATAQGEPVGGAFCRLFTDHDHGDGYVDERTPEIAVAVWPRHRAAGVGGRLLTALAETARAAGFGQLSLSVDHGNPAVGLYRRCGYRTVREDGSGLLMLLAL